ncbi:thioredoxin family protein [Lutimaribacter sp. EGI FJ00015]|uniref:Thioredoxin family protein n=1 Tax=Lutimaribacter degradans TaxID=2945989 RepID=A0ACC5ZWC6_9RHOB|nr:thioredoxin family protein [Lutimaribacter sp. EGI FJ00013]MCM2562366.1 thioredoxin family protein [Lutimaribacter sp. EGI FJ00013]MCO0613523.1 thioredoxin family protein [Lutimaribacter sp. EGI FJ00015]MCO0636495.1 thioredoxin family protein [Lutimaribacter sp. EGI FJ00014]
MKKLILGLWAIMFALPVWAAELGDDGLHKQPWMRDTFKDLRDDLAEANAEGKRLVLMMEQRGCIYCKKMHEEVYPREDISTYIDENFFVVQLNLHGDTEMVDLDGEALSEKAAARKWGILFTPTVIFLPEEVPEGMTAQDAAVAIMPGAFGAQTAYDMFVWVNEKRYELDNGEDFQRYHARKIQERQQQGND